MPALSPDRTPFSYFGSAFAISRLTGKRAPEGKEGLYFRCFHGIPKSAFRLIPLRDNQEASVTIAQEPAALTLTDQTNGKIEFCYDGPQTLRIRGRGGLTLRLHDTLEGTSLCPMGGNLVTLNVSTIRRYQIHCLGGRLEYQGLWNSLEDQKKEIRVDCVPDEQGTWEVAIDEYWSTWIEPQRRGFDACVKIAREAFDGWLAGMPKVPNRYAEARAMAGYIDWSCVVNPEGFLGRHAMLMSKNWMTCVWSWDNCFNAMALIGGHPDLAWDQLLLMVDHQDQHGAYPDYVNDLLIHYNYCKPPVHGWTVMELWRRNPAAATEERLRTIYTSLLRWTEWWLKHRRLGGRALPCYLHGYDSGWDNSTMFDRGAPLIAPDAAAFLIVQMDALHDLAAHLALDTQARHWRAAADEMTAALISELWKGDRFIARLALDGTEVECESLVPCMPLILGPRLPGNVRISLIERIQRFLTDWGLASENPKSPLYKPESYWRGPIWASANCLAISGLERCGQAELARTVAQRFCDLCDKSGFSENYDALTGAPYCDPAYTWTASCFLVIAEKLRMME